MTTQSQRLRETISLVSGHLSSLIRQVWFHPRLSELYPEFLFAIYGITASSAPAMRAAAERCSAITTGEPLARWLHDYYLEHAAEETGHEKWLLDDLAAMGVQRQRVLQRLPYASVAALVGAQYYWMLHVHPIAYLGYIAVVEEPASIEFLEQVSRRSGIPLSTMSCHLMHAKLDPDHVADFNAALDSLPLQQHHQDLITVSAITTSSLLVNVFSDILEHFERIENPAGAETIFTSSGVAIASPSREF